MKIRPPRVVKLKDGTLSHDNVSRKRRWAEQFAEVLSGTIVPNAASTVTCPQRVSGGHLDVPPMHMFTSIQKLGRNKGLGLDPIPAELIQCGGFAAAAKVSELCAKILLYDQ